ncbi:hypothetical protein BP6252_06052 [Coleophoma cylindrospora]|uniref:Uncharacterized protein n=1 Tax=Coleophoma cylindrospora TaxID=1849047 RepID=A0A3D8RLT2_9HELO|nr:hypothetical protein BP6252_06052 [Coleophoma cylindrospora]
MRVVVDAQVEWHFFMTLYPLFKEALPRGDGRSGDRELQNAITTIRHNLRKIPLQVQQGELNQDLSDADFDTFLRALHSLLALFEDLVEGVAQPPCTFDAAVQQEQTLPSLYPKLTALEERLQKLKLDAGEIDDWYPSTEYPSEGLRELVQYVKFHDYTSIATRIREFNATIHNVLQGSLAVSDGDLGNVASLRDDEIDFIRRACHVNLLSSSLFTLLSNRTGACSKAHNARMHLSGFLDPELNIDLFVAGCDEQSWHLTSCRRTLHRPTVCNYISHDVFLEAEPADSPAKRIQIAFDNDSMWEDVNDGGLIEPHVAPELPLSLRKLVFPGRDAPPPAWMTEDCEFEAEDHRIIEVILACSLFHLNASHWIRTGWDMDNILISPTPGAQNPLNRWKPYTACPLELSPLSPSNSNDDILSFGLLIMEMEAKKPLPTDTATDWVTGLPSKDSLLQKVLIDWKRKLEDGYQQIGTACLRFRELVQKFYHPALPDEMKRTAAIYKYILIPLHRLVTQRHCSTSQLFCSFPTPYDSATAPSLRSMNQTWNSNSKLVLFDGDSRSHDPREISNAAVFIQAIRPFIQKVRDLEDSSPSLPSWAPWRADKIRIAIIDTGIDDEDTLIETALENGRIKDCQGFVGDPGDHQDLQGHGTHVTRLILGMAPAAELYIAKISDSKSIAAADFTRISEASSPAIKWAHETKKVHIISMSFGLEHNNRNAEIDVAISNALKSGTTIFAAAANSGGNEKRAYPAKRSGVICIHASDGLGNDGKISPSHLPKKDNFSTLGISIKSKWKGGDVLISGTSFATPVAVSMAADVLEFSRYRCRLSEHEQQYLYSYDGVCEILRLMSTERQQYDYIMPLHLWNSKSPNADSEIATKITEIARQ